MTIVNAGQYRHRVTIQKRTKTETYQGVTEVWADVETRWARVVIVGTKGEAAFNEVGLPEVKNRIIFRGSVTLAMKDHRFEWKSRTFEMVEPARDPDGLGNETTVAIREVVRGGS